MGAKVFTHDVIVNGVFYRAGAPVNMETPEHKEAPTKKAVSAKKETPSTK